MTGLTYVLIIALYTGNSYSSAVTLLNVPGVYESAGSCDMAASLLNDSLIKGGQYAHLEHECLPVTLK